MATLIDNMLDAMEATEQAYQPALRDILISGMDIYLEQVRTVGVFQPLPSSFTQTLVEKLGDLWRDSAGRTLVIMRNEFKDGFEALEHKAAETAEILRITTAYVDRYGGSAAANIINTTERQIEGLVKGGLTRGIAANEVYRQISDKILEIADIRSDVITRTESHAMNQFASQLLAERSAIALKKKWNSIKDERTRRFGLLGWQDAFNHLIMDGQEVSLDQAFSVPRRVGGFERLSFPGDPNGSAGNVINCRCIQTYERLN